MKKNLLFLMFITASSFTMFAQQQSYRVTSGKNMIKGTSTLHDWQCAVERQNGTAVINTNGTLSISSLNVTMAVNSIRSVKQDGSYYDASMDKNLYKAMSAEQYPDIIYTLISLANVNTKGNTTTMRATGNLTIAGKTNRVAFPIKATVVGNNITFSGVTKFKMSAFGIKPPTALMGTIKTGDDITIVLHTTFTK